MTPENGRARVVKRSLAIAGHRTSVSLEDAFWRRLQAIATERGISVNALAADVDASRGEANLSSALRVFVLEAVSAEGRTSLSARPETERPQTASLRTDPS
jgi:predicted DNA-binding ribbon-helix-helix protein